MGAIVLDGVSVARKTEQQLSDRVRNIQLKNGRPPTLATILVGSDPASKTYIKMKQNACKRIGMESVAIELPATTTTKELREKIIALNYDKFCHGILLQHPVPRQINERLCFDAISLPKDVDGVTCLGFGKMSMGEESFGSATPRGIMRLLAAYDIKLTGMHAVVVGRSPILGKPMSMMILNEHATVTICHSKTKNLPEIIKSSDLIVGALGQPEYIKASWVPDGAVVIDAGFHPDGCGDIELGPLYDRVAAITPVPGGVGPMTINTLLLQSVIAAEQMM
ncbi:MAG: bifunctional 5,10-methylene-tetrahydrofolate dehydrogenase/5,10-methylene-tetrahydrofolate cyclohydrolase [Cellvibrionales bacterium TMED49]|nr:bifunctional 5,10-methylene-tetrahydrofolate dehydrogenase/5,10-methylene-tetrahydrofolate cyclohydrolase [Porticoccaceae bacterium]OUU39837.1 MAG: bifunctional 5,10-methylene-tetrahydrofolate dehydrogenase/5,10-methylene-tetrahydrofolate cyclohydrolase [Cellvibrionales bacterium TMED49]